MFFVWEFNHFAEDWKVIGHSENLEIATGLARAGCSWGRSPVVVVDGVHSENRKECAKYLGCGPFDLERGRDGGLVTQFNVDPNLETD